MITRDPETELSHLQRAHLSALVSTDGFKVLKDIMELECEKFKVCLINADPSNASAVLAAHNLAKSAAQFYVAVMNRINAEVEAYRLAPRASDAPEDITDGRIDFGEVASLEEDYNE